MGGMDRAREMARRVQAGERAAMRRWLTQNIRTFETCERLRALDTDQLEVLIWDVGGDPRVVRAEGKKRVTDMLLEEK